MSSGNPRGANPATPVASHHFSCTHIFAGLAPLGSDHGAANRAKRCHNIEKSQSSPSYSMWDFGWDGVLFGFCFLQHFFLSLVQPPNNVIASSFGLILGLRGDGCLSSLSTGLHGHPSSSLNQGWGVTALVQRSSFSYSCFGNCKRSRFTFQAKYL